MKLIETLAAGVAGAEGGTAEVYRRGTSTRVLLYPDFEATQQQFYSPIQLDEHGGAVAYINELANVLVYSEQGVLIREFVVGGQATAVEVISDKFEGTDYETGHVGSGEPTTLIEVLESMQTTIEEYEDVTGEYYNVQRDYDAVGDGVTDDSVAVQSAIDAAALAGGGTVHFPAGTYLLEAEIDHKPGVRLLGASADSVVLFANHAGSVAISQVLEAGKRCVIEKLAIELDGDVTTCVAVTTYAETAANGWSYCNGVRFGDTSAGMATAVLATTAPGSSATVQLVGCEVHAIGAAHAVDGGEADPARIVLLGCRVVVHDTLLLNNVVTVQRGILALNQFDLLEVSGGTASCVSAEPYPGNRSVMLIGNEFLADASYSGSGAAINLLGPHVVEVGNFCRSEAMALLKVSYTVGSDGTEHASLWLSRSQRSFVHVVSGDDEGLVSIDTASYGSARVTVPADWSLGDYAVFTVALDGLAPPGATLALTIEDLDAAMCIATIDKEWPSENNTKTVSAESARTFMFVSVLTSSGTVWQEVIDTDDYDVFPGWS